MGSNIIEHLVDTKHAARYNKYSIHSLTLEM